MLIMLKKLQGWMIEIINDNSRRCFPEWWENKVSLFMVSKGSDWAQF